jgi:MFS family permease
VPVYAWRIAFVIGGLGGILSFVLRRSLEESPEFARMRSLASRQPFRELLRTHTAPVLVGCATLAGTAGFNGLFFSHMPAYLAGVLHYDPRQAVYSQTVGVIASALGILATGWLGDRIPPRYLLRVGVTLLTVLAFPFYTALDARAVNLTLLLTLAGLAAGLTNGSFACLLADLFPTRIRFTGVALVFNVSFTIFSGTAPLVATTMIREMGTTTAPALLMMGCGALALAGSFRSVRYGGHVLVDTGPIRREAPRRD